jgi:alpha-L-fucosidase
MQRRHFLFAPAAGLARLSAAAAPPSPYGATPSPRQLAWHKLETYAFLHFTINTFTDKEWGYGDESPELFNPTAFDAAAIVSALKAGGMTAVILTCKHHDGFCLWPTATTGHSVKKSPWKGGQGDVVREISDAARAAGLKFGVYLSPWDRNAASYASPAYVDMYRAQLRELLTGYGPVHEVWHDGANGGDGFYGGARERRRIDKKTYYDWPKTWDLVRQLAPDAVIFSDVGPDIRWVGNEKGIAGETCWATFDPKGEDGGPASPGDVNTKESVTGHRNGARWLPPECDVSIRPGWFWHEKENDRVKTPAQLLDLYYKSVGRGASFLLNVPPDRRGLLHENDVASLAGFGKLVRETFSTDLAAGATAHASNIRGGSRVYSASNLVDGKPSNFWASDDKITTPAAIFDLLQPSTFNVIRLREEIRLGQRVDEFEVDAWQDAKWRTIAKATSIGNCCLIRLPEEVKTTRVRLRITAAAAAPVLSGFGLFREAAV